MLNFKSRPALIVTRDHWLRTAVGNTLTTLQYEVDSARSVGEALRLARQKKYLVIIAIDGDLGSGRTIDIVTLFNTLTSEQPDMRQNFILMPDKHSEETMDLIFFNKCHYIYRPYNPANLAIELEAMRTKKVLPGTRTENRYNWEGLCKIAMSNKYVCSTMDISNQGVRLLCSGEKIVKDTEVIIHIPHMGYDSKAHVKWSTYKEGNNLIGLDLITPIETEDLKKAVYFAL